MLAWVTRLGRSFGVAGWQAADFQQLQAECFELVDHPVQGAMVGQRADKQGVLTASALGQRRECLHGHRADRPSDADLVALRLTAAAGCVDGWHAIRFGAGRVSAPRMVQMNMMVWLRIVVVQPCASWLSRQLSSNTPVLV